MTGGYCVLHRSSISPRWPIPLSKTAVLEPSEVSHESPCKTYHIPRFLSCSRHSWSSNSTRASSSLVWSELQPHTTRNHSCVPGMTANDVNGQISDSPIFQGNN